MAAISGELNSIRQTLEAQDTLDAERRKVDDARYGRLAKGQEDLVARVDRHGTRTTAVETQLATFFGENGAFRIVLKGIDSLTKDGKLQSRLIYIGMGIILALQFISMVRR